MLLSLKPEDQASKAEWAAQGVSSNEVLAWTRLLGNCGPEDVRHWIDAGFTPEGAKPWVECLGPGLQPEAVDRFLRLDMNAEDVREWIEGQWRNLGFDEPTKCLWIEAGIDFGDAARWRDAGFNPSDARQWHVESIAPEEASRLRDSG